MGFVSTLSSNGLSICQTLRQRIQDEYREVVERRVITGIGGFVISFVFIWQYSYSSHFVFIYELTVTGSRPDEEVSLNPDIRI